MPRRPHAASRSGSGSVSLRRLVSCVVAAVAFGDVVGCRCGVQGAVGEGDGELSGARVELQSPSTFVDSMMMEAAQWQQVGEVGVAEVVPLEEVMDVAHIEVSVAAIDRTGAIHRPQRGALGVGGQPSGPSDVEGHAVAAQHDGDQMRRHRRGAVQSRPAPESRRSIHTHSPRVGPRSRLRSRSTPPPQQGPRLTSMRYRTRSGRARGPSTDRIATVCTRAALPKPRLRRSTPGGCGCPVRE